MPHPRATVVLPVRNGARFLPSLLDALAVQDLAGGFEVLAVDSGSQDESIEILEARRITVLRIPPSAFDHGQTRNLGARAAQGAICLFLSQDATPADRSYARRLVEVLEADARLAGAFARQIPRPDADPRTRRDLARWVAGRAEARTVFLRSREELEAQAPAERYQLAVFDNVASAVRRAVLLEHPFPATRFGEDVEWALGMLRHGAGLAYVPEAAVLHSHPRCVRDLYRRNYLGHRTLFRLFGLRTVPDLRHLMRGVLGTTAGDLALLARQGVSFGQWLGAPAQAIAAVLGQYQGARHEAQQRPYPSWS